MRELVDSADIVITTFQLHNGQSLKQIKQTRFRVVNLILLDCRYGDRADIIGQ